MYVVLYLSPIFHDNLYAHPLTNNVKLYSFCLLSNPFFCFLVLCVKNLMEQHNHFDHNQYKYYFQVIFLYIFYLTLFNKYLSISFLHSEKPLHITALYPLSLRAFIHSFCDLVGLPFSVLISINNP